MENNTPPAMTPRAARPMQDVAPVPATPSAKPSIAAPAATHHQNQPQMVQSKTSSAGIISVTIFVVLGLSILAVMAYLSK